MIDKNKLNAEMRRGLKNLRQNKKKKIVKKIKKEIL